MSAVASQITILTIVYSTVYSGADQRKHQSFASLAFVRGIHRRSVKICSENGFYVFRIFHVCWNYVCTQGNMGEQPVAECFTLYKYLEKKVTRKMFPSDDVIMSNREIGGYLSTTKYEKRYLWEWWTELKRVGCTGSTLSLGPPIRL